MNMTCTNCGSDNPSTAKNCKRCGCSLPLQKNLIAAALQDDQDAYTALYYQAEKTVRLTVYSIISPDNAENADADDIVLESILKGFKSLSQIKNPDSYIPWMRTIARNKAIDYLRKNKDLTFSDLNTEDLEFEDTLVSTRDDERPDLALDASAKAQLLRDILAALPAEQRLVVTMYYYHQMTISEIAQELGCTEATVKSRIKYAKSKIESGVNDLQKKHGIKLYSVSPVMLLTLFLENETTSACQPELLQTLLQSSISSKAAKIGGAAQKTTVKAAAKKGLAAQGKSMATRIVASVMAASLTLGGGAYYATHRYQEGYVSEPKDISKSLRQEIMTHVNEELEEKEFYSAGILPEADAECMGCYVLTSEDKEGNIVYLLYQYTAHFKETNRDVIGYSYLKYKDIWRNKDGTYDANLSKYTTPFAIPGFLGCGTCFKVKSDTNPKASSYFLGYKSVEAFEEDVIIPVQEKYQIRADVSN